MKTSTMKITIGAAALAIGLLAGPAGAQQNSGFLADYSKLAPTADNPNARVWISKDFNFKPFTKLALAPVEVWVSPTSEYKGASPDVFKGMSDRFTKSFKSALKSQYQFVGKPGPDVLRISLAITGVNLVKPAFKPQDAVPIVFLFRAASGAADAKDVVLTAEMQVLDPNNNVVAAGVVHGTSSQTIAQGQAITWNDVQAITDSWAQGLRRRLDAARGIAAKN